MRIAAPACRTPNHTAQGSWRETAACIVEELFPVTDPQHWNRLLDLRTALLKGNDWDRTLDLFLACRCELEADHYLPFYRLRRLISVSLRFEIPSPEMIGGLEDLLRRKHKSLDDLKKAIRRDLFEHSPNPAESLAVELRLVETQLFEPT